MPDLLALVTFNNPNYYKQKLPAELATSRLWQLVYGEFRAPKYMVVMRNYIDTFDWNNVKESDVAMAMKLLLVWSLVPQVRMLEWPTMQEKLRVFAIRLRDEHGQLYHRYNDPYMQMPWIDNDLEWFALIEEPYAALQQ